MRAAKRKIFTTAADIEALALAKIGRSNANIQEETGISTSGKVTYRLKQAALKDNLPKGMGYRKLWAAGKSAESRAFARTSLPVLKRDIRQHLVPQFFHPTPHTVSHLQMVSRPPAGAARRRYTLRVERRAV